MEVNINKILVDADIMVYRCGFATEGAPPSHARQALRYQMRSLETLFPCATMVCILSPLSGNFREEVAVTRKYKGNRVQPKPRHYGLFRDTLMSDYGAEVAYGMEGDDLLGIYQTERSVIITLDKDLDMIPGWHYNHVTKTLYYVNKTQAWRNFCTQVLTGDSTDNIPGCPGIGAKKAEIILNPPSVPGKTSTPPVRRSDKRWMWEQVVRTYNERGHNMKYLEEQATLLWIRREHEVPFDLRRLIND